MIDGLRSQSVALAGLAALTVALIASPAFACGVSGADGAWSCSLAEHEEAERPRWSLGVAGLLTWTELKFDDLNAKERRNAVVIAAAYAPTRRLTLQLSAGAALAGELRAPNGVHEFSVGPTGGAGIVYKLIEGRPFVALSGVLSAFHATTRLHGSGPSVNYDALDLRLGVIAGTTLFDVLSPYIVARAFGGPVFWRYEGRAQIGTDTAHYQFGVGLTLRPIEALAVFVEGVPLGERALSGGASIAF